METDKEIIARLIAHAARQAVSNLTIEDMAMLLTYKLQEEIEIALAGQDDVDKVRAFVEAFLDGETVGVH